MSYQTTTNSPTLGHRTVGTAEDLSLDPTGGRWVVICETHGTIVNTTTLADARATATAEFCEDCRNATYVLADVGPNTTGTTTGVNIHTHPDTRDRYYVGPVPAPITNTHLIRRLIATRAGCTPDEVHIRRANRIRKTGA